MQKKANGRFEGCGVLMAGVALWLAPSAALALDTDLAGQPYIDFCEAQGVPIPTVIDTTGGNGWTKKGDLSPDFIAEMEGFGPAEVHYWTHSDESVCIALPRGQRGTDLWSAIGVICQDRATGKACFFDTRAPVPKAKGIYPLQGSGELDFVGGTELVSRCTGCHVGPNAFIVHPGGNAGEVGSPTGFGSLFDPADPLIPFLRADTYYDPIIPAVFPQNPPPSDLGCGGCHSPSGPFGPFVDYSMATGNPCDLLLWSVGDGELETAKTMPSGARPIPPEMLPSYNALREACGQLPLPEFNPAMQNMSFDNPDRWAASAGTLSLDTVRFTEGRGSISVGASGYINVTSVPFDTWFFDQVGSELRLDVFIPEQQPNPFWLGAVQLFVTIPGTGQVNQFLGHVELTPLGRGWKTLTFQVPSAIESSLLTPQTGVRFSVAVNTPEGAPPLLLDNLRFAGALQDGPPSPPRGVTRFEFERGLAWTGVEGSVTSSQISSDVGGYNTPSALKVNVAPTGTEGLVYTQPHVSPEPGSTVRLRVYIPSGAPVTAIQPYIMDQNWEWVDSWNPDLPRDSWVTLSVDVPEDILLPLNELGLKIYTSTPYSGPIYIDAIEI